MLSVGCISSGGVAGYVEVGPIYRIGLGVKGRLQKLRGKGGLHRTSHCDVAALASEKSAAPEGPGTNKREVSGGGGGAPRPVSLELRVNKRKTSHGLDKGKTTTAGGVASQN